MAIDPNVKITTRENASVLIKPEAANEIFKLVSQNSVALKTMRRLPNMNSKTKSMPVTKSLPVAYFVNGDTGQKQTTKIAWEGVTLHVEEIAVIMPFPENVLDDADFNITAECIPEVAAAMGEQVDGAVLWGINAPATWPMGLVPLARNQGHTVKLAGGEYNSQDFYQKVLGPDGLYAQVEEDGFPVTGLMADLKTKAYIRGLTDTTGRPLTVGGADINNQQINYIENSDAWKDPNALLLAGDFRQAVYAMRKDIEVKRFTEGVIQNPDGTIAYNLMQEDMVALRFVMRLAWAVANPVSRRNPNGEKRYPFSILMKNVETPLQPVKFTVSSDTGSTKVQGATVVLGNTARTTPKNGEVTINVPAGYSGEWIVTQGDIVRKGTIKDVSKPVEFKINNFKADAPVEPA